jgi:hypothetical protein
VTLFFVGKVQSDFAVCAPKYTVIFCPAAAYFLFLEKKKVPKKIQGKKNALRFPIAIGTTARPPFFAGPASARVLLRAVIPTLGYFLLLKSISPICNFDNRESDDLRIN